MLDCTQKSCKVARFQRNTRVAKLKSEVKSTNMGIKSRELFRVITCFDCTVLILQPVYYQITLLRAKRAKKIASNLKLFR